MRLTPLITKEQIGKYVRISDNMRDADIAVYIEDVVNYDIVPVLPDALLTAIEVNILQKIQQWNKNESYVTGNKVFLKSVAANGTSYKWFIAVVDNSDSVPPSANWADLELMNFWEQYLQPLMAQMVMYRLMLAAGQSLTQLGFNVTTDPQGTFQPISDSQRGARLADVKNKINIEIAKVSKRLSDINYTLDGVVYENPNGCCNDGKLKPKMKVFALGTKHKNCRDEWQQGYPY